jgi:hypothetical protein
MRSIHPFTRFCSLAVLALPLAFAACSQHSDPDNAPALILEPNSPIADAPVPVSFNLMVGESSSHVVPSSSLRFVDHSYSGTGSQLMVVRFYRDVMPTKGWTFVVQDQAHKEISLKFTKNNEDCIVMVKPTLFHTHIRIKIDPKAADAAK